MTPLFRILYNYFGLYYLLFFLSYLSLYYFPAVAPYLNSFLLAFSYYLIIARKRLDVVISLILYCRCLNGFIVMHNKTAYDIINILNNVVPVILYFIAVLYQRRVPVSQALREGKFSFTILFFLYLSVSFLLNFSTSTDLVTKRYLPFLFFVVFLFLFHRPADFDVNGIIRFFRCAFFATMVIYFLPGYLERSRELIESDSVFSIASPPNSYSLQYFSFTRNMGFVWDHRILAIFSYVFLLLVLVFRPSYYKWDIILSSAVVITSTSRGGMITYALILGAFLFIRYRYRLFGMLAIAGVFLTLFLIFEKQLVSTSTSLFIRSFNPGSSDNALNQRSVFRVYAMDSFKEKPLVGHGVGYLSSTTIKRDLVVDGRPTPAVGDAYWFVLLAEMGLIGLILYALFLFEIFYSQSILNIAMLLGFAIQLLGTDIPDMRFFYFAFLVLVFIANKELKARARVPETTLA